jgi:hypothetical protein
MHANIRTYVHTCKHSYMHSYIHTYFKLCIISEQTKRSSKDVYFICKFILKNLPRVYRKAKLSNQLARQQFEENVSAVLTFRQQLMHTAGRPVTDSECRTGLERMATVMLSCNIARRVVDDVTNLSLTNVDRCIFEADCGSSLRFLALSHIHAVESSVGWYIRQRYPITQRLEFMRTPQFSQMDNRLQDIVRFDLEPSLDVLKPLCSFLNTLVEEKSGADTPEKNVLRRTGDADSPKKQVPSPVTTCYADTGAVSEIYELRKYFAHEFSGASTSSAEEFRKALTNFEKLINLMSGLVALEAQQFASELKNVFDDELLALLHSFYPG